ncbi:MAG: TIR domain-containing protein, partial [Candidatus Hydrothermarchaeaceae archaeon]
WAKRALDTLKGDPEATSSNSGTALDPTVETLNRLDSHGKAIAHLILNRIETSDISIITSLVGHTSKSVRTAAQKAIREGGKPAHDVFINILGKNKLPITIEHVQLLCEIQDTRAVRILLETARKDKGELRFKCINALSNFEGIAYADEIETLLEFLTQWSLDANYLTLRELRNAICAIGQAAQPAVLQSFVHNSEIRRREGRLVAQVVGESAVPVFIQALKDRYRVVRENAAGGLELLGKSAARELVKLIPIADLCTKRLAISTLGRVGELETYDVIVTMLDDPGVRDVAIESLGGFPTDNSFKLLSGILRGAESKDKRYAWKAVERFIEDDQLHPQVFPLLLSVLKAPTYKIRMKALEYIYRLKMFGDVSIETAVDSLVEVLHDPDPELIKRVLNILVQLGDAGRDRIQQKLHLAFGEKHPYIESEYIERMDAKRKETRKDKEPGLRSGLSGAMFAVLLDRPMGPRQKPSLPDASPTVPYPITDQVHFSVSAPMVSVPGAHFILGVWAHQLDIREVLQRARRQQRGADVYIVTKGGVPVEREALLEVDISIPEFYIDRISDTMYWFGGGNSPIGNCTFPVTVPQDATTGTYLGEVKIRLRDLQIAKLDFVLEVGSKESSTDDITGFENRYSSAFASYSRSDRNKVLGRIQGMLKVLPDLDIFLDVVSLRSGEDWQRRVREEIEARELFFLFWSKAASRSHWVETEWRIALAAKGIESISPVPLQPPGEVTPPKELNSLHFDEWTLAFEDQEAKPNGLSQ